ncbi:E3 ubiquitin-protein transferase RMND5B isoform X7 [Leptidea sinapis]|uniref:E3 ubiquitin-protein transferase RMND5B isoform X1 n=1 Tax=Leptidea sinapis TaxID=189913 RepID=UPI0021C2AB1E|nr:E3 ubiquitin-protein transferase RMND5B isoform X1 [Leptidea sinapis]XP_050666794.1 E3 ubiquitin-protein transferase RMND5B isoform X2 [Leptidea sinapis]XP_050666795.1 E3 ubiquitin-protein transferase RMND5B isoform X3 [Leptidea sinapis]XP_050666796.1 E3 ubiquitin-protein transferase RMND5B isoform X4 [Leptidea sinapis]XP_050666797.1 E3 ubiquitin-protein transferase RMND5B isoform X5 [Leptidea sinapis]XP_050666798.1 E3 ubiquitin-protein transferase RMND5B isoform X6 [Leptidea sinapis]XP_05
MDSCLGVEQDLDKATTKFTALNEHTNNFLQDLICRVECLKKEISQNTANTPLTPDQAMVISDLAAALKQSVFQISTDHRELHATVSRVGKSIDRHFITDYASVAPKAESFCNDTNRPIMEQAIAQHLYRQGLEDVGDTFVAEANVAPVERTCTFAQLQRCAAALAEGDPALAIEWVQKHAEDLEHSPLPFTLHRMQALKLAREKGVVPAIEYARENFPAHATRHERQLQAAVCALAWCTPAAPPAPQRYTHLLDPKALGLEASELFTRSACSVVGVAALSPLAGAVLAGARVVPALHDIRAKMAHPHVVAAWADDELPLEVDLGEEGGGYHSVFACPILRQQASEQNPPMRLLCGHVISRDALNKLALGLKLKCPYCPMEQSPAEARQIYFS